MKITKVTKEYFETENEKIYFLKPLEKEISIEDIQKIIDAWNIVKTLYPIVTDDCITLTVNSYDFNRNVFSVITDKHETVEFDPFVGCAIEQSDDEYYQQAIGHTVVGHKFVVKSLVPLPSELIFTTWKKKQTD
jgi:hypothetical protein